jgi:hypothetical protein
MYSSMSTKENGAANKNNINKKNGVEPVAAAVNGVEPVAAAATNGVNDVNGAAEEVVPNHQNGGRHKKRRTKHRKTKSRKHRATKSRKHRR